MFAGINFFVSLQTARSRCKPPGSAQVFAYSLPVFPARYAGLPAM